MRNAEITFFFACSGSTGEDRCRGCSEQNCTEFSIFFSVDNKIFTLKKINLDSSISRDSLQRDMFFRLTKELPRERKKKKKTVALNAVV